jgi:hypothetical protein
VSRSSSIDGLLRPQPYSGGSVSVWLFPIVSPHDPTWLDRMDHLRELLLLAEPLTQTLARPAGSGASVGNKVARVMQ